MATDSKAHRPDEGPAATSRWIPLGNVTQPGTYVAKQTGDLIRIPPDGASSGDEQKLLDKSAQEEMLVTKISDDPFIPITKARFAAAALDVEVSF